MVITEESPVYGPFFGVMGAASAIIFSGKLSALRRKKKKAKWKNFANFLSLGENFALFRLFILIMLFILPSSSWSRLWNRKIWNWYRRDECHET
jgi:apolipoprotein N-acyltransferase